MTRRAPDGEFVGPWYAWWPRDPLPALPPPPGFAAAPADDDRVLAALAGIGVEEVAAWRRVGNQPYLARMAGEPVGYGWSAGRRLEIGELGLAHALPPGERYLWGFATAERWRGRGVYPLLLQAILCRERMAGARFWIGHARDNAASARGILRAGFRHVGDVYRLPTEHLALVPVGPIERARVGAALLGAVLCGDGGGSQPAE